MSRSLTSATQSASVAAKNGPIWFVFMDFESGPIYAWTGIGPISWNGQTWQGVGDIGQISGLNEATDSQATGPTFSLNGAPSSTVSLVFADNYNGRTVKAWLGMRDTNTDAITADPYPVFVGRMDMVEITRDDGATCDIAVHAESKNYAPNQADDRRWNDGDQQIDFPGDTGFAYLSSVGQRSILWGQPNPTTTTSGSGSGRQGAPIYMP